MAHLVTVPEGELSSFDLPRVCVVTGETEGVEFRPVKFSWYPRWVMLLVLFNLLIAAIVAMALTKKVKGELPFSEAAWTAWKRGQALFALSCVLAIAAFVGGIALLVGDNGGLGVAAMVLAIALPVGVGVAFLANRGPVVQRIADGTITLKLPSAQAAHRIELHLAAGSQRPRAALSRSA
ncbi:hypothetical protein P2318_02765 [Myxococcaceae bacterium GXIMD 01537]